MMVMRYFACAMLSLMATPAFAGEREASARAATGSTEATLVHADGHGMILVDRAVRLGNRAFELPIHLPAATLDLRSRKHARVPVSTLSLPAAPHMNLLRMTEGIAAPGFVLDEEEVAVPRQWRLNAVEAASDPKELAFSDRATRQGLRTFPRTRRSALDTMLVLRIDGQEESPTFSVGGGVAAAVWSAIPRQ